VVLNSKQDIRLEVKQFQHNVDEVEAIAERIQNWHLFQTSKKLAFYFAMKDEVSLDFLFESGKELFLPRFEVNYKKYEMCLVSNKDELVVGEYGIKEPGKQCRIVEINEIDLWFIPGMAFSRLGHRLGRGAGFYDRLLENEGGLKCGVCISRKIIEGIPAESHDIKMNFVLTDKEIITIN